jgi:hypothetical protein
MKGRPLAALSAFIDGDVRQTSSTATILWLWSTMMIWSLTTK